MKMMIRPSHDDPHNSVDLFDRDRRNQWGEFWCVAPAILYSQVKEEWRRYEQECKDQPI